MKIKLDFVKPIKEKTKKRIDIKKEDVIWAVILFIIINIVVYTTPI